MSSESVHRFKMSLFFELYSVFFHIFAACDFVFSPPIFFVPLFRFFPSDVAAMQRPLFQSDIFIGEPA